MHQQLYCAQMQKGTVPMTIPNTHYNLFALTAKGFVGDRTSLNAQVLVVGPGELSGLIPHEVLGVPPDIMPNSQCWVGYPRQSDIPYLETQLKIPNLKV